MKQLKPNPTTTVTLPLLSQHMNITVSKWTTTFKFKNKTFRKLSFSTSILAARIWAINHSQVIRLLVVVPPSSSHSNESINFIKVSSVLQVPMMLIISLHASGMSSNNYTPTNIIPR